MQYEYNFEHAFPEIMGEAAEGALIGAAGIVTGIFLLVYFLLMAFSVASYVLSAVGMYRIAKRRGIHHPWLAWVPIGNSWLLGGISDHYQYVAKQKVTKRRKTLLILNIVMLGISVLFSGTLAATVLAVEGTGGEVLSVIAIALSTISYIGVMGLSVAIVIFSYIAYYDLFQSSKPNFAVLFLVLGIIFNVTLPFFVFACSESDSGMPPRRPRQPAQNANTNIDPLPAPEPEEIPVVETELVEDSE